MQKMCADKTFWHNLNCSNSFREPETSEAPRERFARKENCIHFKKVFQYSLFSEISIGSFYVPLMHESRGRLGTCLLFCMASVFAPLYACAYASGLPSFVCTFVLGKLRSATCTAHVYACVAAGVHRYFRKFHMLSTQRG